MPKVFIFCHGLSGHCNYLWFKIIRNSLEEKGIKTVSETFPKADDPRYPEWSVVLDKMLSENFEGNEIMLAYIEKMKDILFILIVTAAYSVIAHFVGSNGDLAAGSIGALVLVAITVIGIVLSWLPGLKMLPMVFWVSIVAVVVSMPQFPLSDWILAQTKNVGFLSITTPILAYGGLCLGKDLQAFKALSWRIVPVALAVAAGSFICATALAEIMLHLEGIF